VVYRSAGCRRTIDMDDREAAGIETLLQALVMRVAEFEGTTLLSTEVVSVWDVACPGACTSLSDEECADTTQFVFPYLGVYLRHVGRTESVAEPIQVVIFNAGEVYRVSHPVDGGDSCLSIEPTAQTLLELAPDELLRGSEQASLKRSQVRIAAHTQALAATLRHRLNRGAVGVMEAETMTLALIRHALGNADTDGLKITARSRILVDQAKLVIGADLSRRLTLAEIAAEVAVSPVYLTQLFQRVEGIPLYRYQLRLRLARALQLLNDYDDVTELALDLGFSSHSHFSASFKQVYGQTPSTFRRSARRH
jgi:AraC family transcriptional regulator